MKRPRNYLKPPNQSSPTKEKKRKNHIKNIKILKERQPKWLSQLNVKLDNFKNKIVSFPKRNI